jgi:hypothetical protein
MLDLPIETISGIAKTIPFHYYASGTLARLHHNAWDVEFMETWDCG